MMLKKKLISISMIVLVGICITFAGCGSADEEGGSQSGQADSAQAQETPDKLSFVTEDLEGNEVRSDDLFGESKITMINVWGTYCGPCINEMADIEKLYKKYGKKDVAVVGLLVDVTTEHEEYLPDAEKIIEDTGVTYLNLRSWEGINDELFITAVPTTYFVDSEGNVLGEPVIGAYVEGYREALDQYLEAAEQ